LEKDQNLLLTKRAEIKHLFSLWPGHIFSVNPISKSHPIHDSSLKLPSFSSKEKEYARKNLLGISALHAPAGIEKEF